VDMMHTGEYETNTTVGFTQKEVKKRKEGETWEDEYHKYEQKKGYYVKSSKNSDIYTEIRDYVRQYDNCKNPECKTISYKPKDTKFIKKTGLCMNCTVDLEHNFRTAGIWKEYETYRIATRMIIDGKLRIEQLRQAHDEAKQVYEFVNEDGSLETWTVPQDVETMKKEIMEIIEKGLQEIKDLEEQRDKAFETIKSHGYEHLI
jgi:hypothetical protein